MQYYNYPNKFNIDYEYVDQKRQEQKLAINRILNIVNVKRATCVQCGFIGMNNYINKEDYKLLNDEDILDSWIYDNNLCEVCSNINMTKDEIKNLKINVNKYMRLVRAKYLCDICNSRTEYFFTKEELKQHIINTHDSYRIRERL